MVILCLQLMIVMELMPNGDLKNYLDRFNNNRYVMPAASEYQ